MAEARLSWRTSAAATTCLVVTAGCGLGGSTHQDVASVVALGDSVPAGVNCDCAPYPELSAGWSSDSAHEVAATNDAVSGSTTEGVLRQLETDRRVMQEVGAAQVVEVEVGANDVAHNDICGSDASCYASEVPPMQARLRAIVDQIHHLTAGRDVLVVLLDYWSVWLGGAYAQQQGEAYVTAAADVTGLVNTAVRSTAQDTGSAYVDLLTAFKGPDHAYDETHYLSDDGDHPNAAGHEQIAHALVAVVEPKLPR